MSQSRHEITVIMVASPGFRSLIGCYAEMIAGNPGARIYSTDEGGLAGLVAELKCSALTERVDLIVSEWMKDPKIMQRLLRSAQELELPAVFIRPGTALPGGRLVVSTSGGPNICEQMWIAREISTRIGRPLEILHWQDEGCFGRRGCSAGDFAVEKILSHLLGIQPVVHQPAGSDFITGVAEWLAPDDLLIMGAPSSLRCTADFAGSLPDQVEKRIKNPLFLFSSPEGCVRLRRLFWGELIKPQMRAGGKEEALSLLVDNLVDHNQLPANCKAEILRRVLRREKRQSAAVDCETAFPHVTLPGCFGVVCSMGIFPEGVDFKSADGSLSRFICLFVTPEGFSDEYLTALAKIAKRMVLPDVRQALLRSETSVQALDILEPNSK